MPSLATGLLVGGTVEMPRYPIRVPACSLKPSHRLFGDAGVWAEDEYQADPVMWDEHVDSSLGATAGQIEVQGAGCLQITLFRLALVRVDFEFKE